MSLVKMYFEFVWIWIYLLMLYVNFCNWNFINEYIIFNKKIGIFCVNFYVLVFVFIFFLGVILDGGKCYI